jgi:hypothetical protein
MIWKRAGKGWGDIKHKARECKAGGSVADPGYLSRIPDPDFYPSRIRDPRSGKNLFRIPDPGVKKAPDPGSGSATLAGGKRQRGKDGGKDEGEGKYK